MSNYFVVTGRDDPGWETESFSEAQDYCNELQRKGSKAVICGGRIGFNTEELERVLDGVFE